MDILSHQQVLNGKQIGIYLARSAFHCTKKRQNSNTIPNIMIDKFDTDTFNGRPDFEAQRRFIIKHIHFLLIFSLYLALFLSKITTIFKVP